MEVDRNVHRQDRSVDDLMDRAALECTEERERYLAIFTTGMDGYVCRNESATDETRALFKGHYRDCQVWIERRGISAAFRYLVEHISEVPELARRKMAAKEILAFLANRLQ